ncbi:cell wall-binding repeat-containing protein [Herbiconiux liukaitaii]|uniref:cell wall-binding repeat-containing protein n=1 Tax=Herbiconiux liukaitaii TaxID=3342799 RepID=UPI0035B8016B
MTHTPPLPSRRGGRLAVTALVSSLALGAALLPAAAASADTVAPTPPKPACAQSIAVVGFPVTPTPLVPKSTPAPVLDVEVTGTLPAGLSLVATPAYAYIVGSPTRTETVSYTVTAEITLGGVTTTSSIDCTMAVEKAPTTTRIGGTDRYDQSVLVSKATYTSAKTVYLASGEKFTDALSASSVAAHHEAPLLLSPQAGVTPGVLAEIERLAATNVVIVGGPATLAPAVADQVAALKSAPKVSRIGGADRFEVSRNLIASPDFGIPKADDLYIATGATFPDALGASPAAALVDAPVLLVNGSATALTATEKATLATLGTKHAVVVGGPASISPSLFASIAKNADTSERIDGIDRYQVNSALNADSFTSADSLYLASATVFPDALSGGAAAGQGDSPLYITQANCVSPEAGQAIGRLAPETVFVLGGTATLGTALDTLTPCSADVAGPVVNGYTAREVYQACAIATPASTFEGIDPTPLAAPFSADKVIAGVDVYTKDSVPAADHASVATVHVTWPLNTTPPTTVTSICVASGYTADPTVTFLRTVS